MKEKEKIPSAGGEIESCKATLEYLMVMFSRERSIDEQLRQVVVFVEGIDDPVKYHKEEIVKDIKKAIQFLNQLSGA